MSKDLAEMVAGMGEQLPWNKYLGVTVRSAEPGRCEVVLPPNDDLLNHIGTPHAIAQLAPGELAGAVAAASRLPELIEQGYVPVVAGLNVRYHAPAGDEVVALAEVTEEQADAVTTEDDRVRLPVEISITSGDVDVATMTVYYVFLPAEE